MARLIIVEDEPDAAELLSIHARRAGHEVTIIDDGGKAIAIIKTLMPDLVVLDHMLPGMNGREITKALRDDPDTRELPIILLTARAAEEDRIRGFESGADDYVTKPYSIKELMLRIARHLQRRKPVSSGNQRLHAGAFDIDLATQTFLLNDEPIHLTAIEFKFLVTLLRQPGQIIPKHQLLTEVWGYSADTDTRTIDAHLRRMRAKLGDQASAIETIPGVGYRFQHPA